MNPYEEERMYIETKEIIKHLSPNLYIKIPKRIKNFIENYTGSGNYSFKYDVKKKLKDQNVSKQTKDFIALLHLNCWCTEKERHKLIENLKRNSNIDN